MYYNTASFKKYSFYFVNKTKMKYKQNSTKQFII